MLRRVVFFVTLAAFVVALTSFNTASAGPQGKTLICHCSEQPDELEPNGWFVIEVGTPAVPAHLAHGDCLVYEPPEAAVGEACACVQ